MEGAGTIRLVPLRVILVLSILRLARSSPSSTLAWPSGPAAASSGLPFDLMRACCKEWSVGRCFQCTVVANPDFPPINLCYYLLPEVIPFWRKSRGFAKEEAV